MTKGKRRNLVIAFDALAVASMHQRHVVGRRNELLKSLASNCRMIDTTIHPDCANFQLDKQGILYQVN